ncbi:YjiH family protein, partial [Staphylococcus aureus]|nr:YjiH family protein [Staphylococcus aureus]
MNQYHSNAQQPSAWRFFVYSLVGILCFFIPFTINGNNTIFVDHVHLAIRSIIGPLMPYVALIMILIGTALPIVRRTFMTSITNLVITLFKVAGAMIGIMYVFKIGPSILFKANYGPFLFEKLMMPLSILIPVGAIALSL